MCNDTVVTLGVLNETSRDSKEPLSWAFTSNYGLAITSDLAKKVITWPPQAFFKNRSKQFVADLYIKRIDWHEDAEGAVDALKLTLSDG